jgi:hypothetical protein
LYEEVDRAVWALRSPILKEHRADLTLIKMVKPARPRTGDVALGSVVPRLTGSVSTDAVHALGLDDDHVSRFDDASTPVPLDLSEYAAIVD